MTSSLVGSEMCIRDSDKADHDEDQRRDPDDKDDNNDDNNGDNNGGNNTCLLYTSDAADDM
eukprot:8013619-Prorocentrum_lima.AAC.1